MSAIWHDLECGSYGADLGLWRDLAQRHPGPVLDIGAGTGRISLELARGGHAVTALDLDGELLAELDERAGGLAVTTVVADARAFDLGRRFGLCIVPMQTIQLLEGAAGRRRFLGCALAHLQPGGVLAIALADELECFDAADGATALPDVVELDGVVYCSRPTAVRADGDGFVLERRRETVTSGGELSVERNLIRLDRLDADTLEREASEAGLHLDGRLEIAPTRDYVGSLVVLLGG
jgi:SAM-dependent methyltransferase